MTTGRRCSWWTCAHSTEGVLTGVVTHSGGWRLAAGGWRLAARGWKLEAGSWKLESGGEIKAYDPACHHSLLKCGQHEEI
jgi:hypothetical protein